MKVTISLAVILAVFVAYAQTQPPTTTTPGPTPGPTPVPVTCPNAPRNATCRGRAEVGNGGSGCRAGQRWAYNERTRTCSGFQYRGCGGSSNRHCTEQACQTTCRR